MIKINLLPRWTLLPIRIIEIGAAICSAKYYYLLWVRAYAIIDLDPLEVAIIVISPKVDHHRATARLRPICPGARFYLSPGKALRIEFPQIVHRLMFGIEATKQHEKGSGSSGGQATHENFPPTQRR